MNLPDMLAGIVDHRLDGAACTGRWRLFDPRDDHEPADHFAERVEAAQHICAACPVRHACHATAQNLRPAHRAGVWGGIAYDRNGRPIT